MTGPWRTGIGPGGVACSRAGGIEDARIRGGTIASATAARRAARAGARAMPQFYRIEGGYGLRSRRKRHVNIAITADDTAVGHVVRRTPLSVGSVKNRRERSRRFFFFGSAMSASVTASAACTF